jgi:hypothetical protein
MILRGYSWLYAAFAFLLTVATWLDLTHVGDALNVVAALGGTLGLYVYLYRGISLPTSFWRSLLVLIAAYELVTVFLVITTSTRGFNWLIGSTSTTSKAYDLIVIALGLPTLGVLWHLARARGTVRSWHAAIRSSG